MQRAWNCNNWREIVRIPSNTGANEPQVLVVHPHLKQLTEAAAIWDTEQLVEPIVVAFFSWYSPKCILEHFCLQNGGVIKRRGTSIMGVIPMQNRIFCCNSNPGFWCMFWVWWINWVLITCTVMGQYVSIIWSRGNEAWSWGYGRGMHSRYSPLISFGGLEDFEDYWRIECLEFFKY